MRGNWPQGPQSCLQWTVQQLWSSAALWNVAVTTYQWLELPHMGVGLPYTWSPPYHWFTHPWVHYLPSTSTCPQQVLTIWASDMIAPVHLPMPKIRMGPNLAYTWSPHTIGSIAHGLTMSTWLACNRFWDDNWGILLASSYSSTNSSKSIWGLTCLHLLPHTMPTTGFDMTIGASHKIVPFIYHHICFILTNHQFD